MKTLMMSLAAVGLLAGCAPVNDGGSAVTPPADGPSACKADQYQRFVGMNRSQLPATPRGETWRVTCSSCPITMDYSPQRLNIFYNEATGTVREVKCG